MSKVVLGLILGTVLGALDGLSTIFVPEAAEMLTAIIVGSTLKGLLTGAIVGAVALRLHSMAKGILVGLGVGLVLSFLVALMPDPTGEHHFVEIMLPGAVLGVIVGFATQRWGRAPTA